MLIVKEEAPSTVTHNFILTEVDITNKISFHVTSETYTGVDLSFTLESDKGRIYPGFTVDVHLFKNSHFVQNDIVELRIDGLNTNNGKIGYFFRLDTLLQPNMIQVPPHAYSFAYYGLEFLFSQQSTLQTKDIELTTKQLSISDFFDDETIMLVICNQNIQPIVNFNINNYLPQLFKYGFNYFNKSTKIETVNDCQIIYDNYDSLDAIRNGEGLKVLRIESDKTALIPEGYVSLLYNKLLCKNTDITTRFIMIYQVIEILIGKVLHYEIQNTVCNNLPNVTGIKLRELLQNAQKEKPRISWLISKYSNSNSAIESQLKINILDFFIHVNDPEYADPTTHSSLTLVDLFYDYRNKLVHNFQLIHNPAIDFEQTKLLMQNINKTSEVFVANLISTFHN